MSPLDPAQKAKLLERYQAELDRLERELPDDVGFYDLEVAIDEFGQRLLGETLATLSGRHDPAVSPPRVPELPGSDATQRSSESEAEEPLG